MFTSDQIARVLRESATVLMHDFDYESIESVNHFSRTYCEEDFPEFKRDLIEAGNRIQILMLENSLERSAFFNYVNESLSPVLVFCEATQIAPCLLIRKNGKFQCFEIGEVHTRHHEVEVEGLNLLRNTNGEIIFLTIFNYENPFPQAEEGTMTSPMKRLFQLLRTERKEIFYILFYAVVVGLVSLILPLGIQTTVELVSGGVVFSSVYVMIGLVITGVLLAGILQIVQIRLVEFLQRRIFTKAAFEFAFRLPRVRLEALANNYAPELVNRFFDVITIQKGLPKLLIDLSSAGIQIIFGLFLISLYHPFFVFYGLLLISTLILIFYTTGPRGLKSSIQESKYKYKVAQWLEEIARVVPSFKLAGSTDLPIRNTDRYVNNYLKFRTSHFRTLITQYGVIVLFKAAIVGGLLIMGTLLVVDRQITLGQFVASEVIIVLTLNAVEKIIMYMDVVYDLLTAVDKVAHVTDLPLEKAGGLDFGVVNENGLAVMVKNLRYRYREKAKYALNGIDLTVLPGQKICLSGPGGGGKTTLVNVLTGLYSNFEGIATIDNYSLRDLDLTHLRDFVSKNISPEDLFDGTILENVTVGKPLVTTAHAINAMNAIGILDEVNAMPEGLNARVLSGGKGLPDTFIQKLIIARCLAKRPKLLILNDFFTLLTRKEKKEIVARILSGFNQCTVIFVSNDPLIQQVSDRIIWLDEGLIKAEGSWQQIEQILKSELSC